MANKNHQDNNENMAYWLSNTSVLVFLIHRSLKPEGASAVQISPPPTSLFGRMAMGFRSSSVSLAAPAAALEIVRQVEAKYPALLFKRQLTAYVEKIYGIVRDNLKKELASLLTSCIQAPRESRRLRSGRSLSKDSQSSHWQGMVGHLNTLLKALKDNFVPPIIVWKIFSQVFSYINVKLFNSLLLRRECRSFRNGEYVKAGLAELELWCYQAKEEVLSVQQLYRICTLYWDDKHNTMSVSPEVLSSMRLMMTEDSNTSGSSSFLLDDDSRLPYFVDDLSTSLQVKDFADVKPAVLSVQQVDEYALFMGHAKQHDECIPRSQVLSSMRINDEEESKLLVAVPFY
ncbi:unconventional myosin [Artemisia annua]|uniref:Unconventional myosin n=1 Tax=Artemisia annua TaxID=35608 RepID=A0A2U1KU69_ARTAN|nr:unconventional myosin [Artemisia annua]